MCKAWVCFAFLFNVKTKLLKTSLVAPVFKLAIVGAH